MGVGNKRNLFGVLLVCTLLVLLVNCVDRSKFKTCDQLDFCRRNRNFETHNHPGVQVVPGSVKKASSSQINFEITSPQSENLKLRAELTAYKQGIARLQITDGHDKRFKGPQDALVENITLGQFNDFVERGSSFVVVQSYAANQVRTIVTYSPFRIDTFVNGVKKIGANARGLFNFEHIRASREEDNLPEKILNPDSVKPETWNDILDGEFKQETMDNPKASGRWEENFGSFKDSKPKGPQDISLDFTFYDSEFVFGLPEHATDVNLKMTREATGDNKTITDPYRLWNLDVFEYELDNPMALYGAVPLLYSLHSSANPTFSGIFWLNSAETWVDISNTSTDTSKQINSHWISETGVLDFFILPGPEIKTNLFPQYASLTGTTPLPPLWSLGYHQCKWNYRDEREVYEIADGFEKADIPMDVIWLDIEHTDGKRYFTWDKNFFPDPLRMLNRIADQKRKMVNIVDPHMKKDSEWRIDNELTSTDAFIKDRENRNYEGTCWPGNSGWIDYMLPHASDWWSRQFLLKNYVNTTKDLHIWNDMNEPSVFSGPEITMDKDALHFKGTVEHRDVHNYYGFLMTRATFKGLQMRGYENPTTGAVVVSNDTAGQRPFVLTRSFFAGSQRYVSVWTGDNTADWNHMRYSIPMTLTIAAAGVPFIGADVGGFFKDAGPELLTRWYQVAALQPFFREHGELATRRKEPFLYNTPWLESITRAIKKRYAYLPVIYGLFELHERTGIPVHRPLWMEFPKDTNTYNNQRQFMLGSDLMVAPVLEETHVKNNVYFPGDSSVYWYDDDMGTRQIGGTTVEVDAAIDKLPVYQRGGSIVVKRSRVRRSTQCMKGDKVTLVIALNESRGARGDFYEDDGDGYDYKNKNKYVRSEIVMEADGKKIVGRRIGGAGVGPEVERIMMFGIDGPSVRRVSVKRAGKNDGPDLWFGRDKTLLVIKSPGVNLGEDWRIELSS